jgi:hypothetical protein
MSKGFQAKPIVASRPSGAEIRDLVTPAVQGVAVQAPQGEPRQEGGGRMSRRKAVPTVQINFRVSEGFAKLIAREAEQAGGMRKWFARIIQDAGYEVPEIDLHPPVSRREW